MGSYLTISGNDSTGYHVKGVSDATGEIYVFPNTSEGSRRAEAQCEQLNKLAKLTSAPSPSSSGSSNYSTDNSSGGNYRSAKMHWLYFLLIGWWLGLTMACLIFPLFIRGFVKKTFGYW